MTIELRGYEYRVETETDPAMETTTDRGMFYQPESIEVIGIYRPNGKRNLIEIVRNNAEANNELERFEEKLND